MDNEQVTDLNTTRREAVRVRLTRWFEGATGQALLAEEKDHLDEILPNLFGYHIAQIGDLAGESLIINSRISHQMQFNIIPSEKNKSEGLVCRSSQLPIEANSIDVVLLPHVLEFEDDPHEVLREIERILIGEGHIVLLGFNPLSIWGLWHLLLAWRQEPPWSGHFYSPTRIRDWLGLLGFDIVKMQSIYFRPPTRSKTLIKRLAFLEKLGNYAFPWFGATYLIVGKKRLLPLTPTKTLWRTRRNLISASVTEARSMALEMTRNRESSHQQRQ